MENISQESRQPSPVKAWIEAMRLRTLPVSVAGVLVGWGCALMTGKFLPVPAVLCLLFALIAQIASNFANEYYDFKGGLDRKGREGFRRGVTEGDIAPGAMKRATFALIGVDAIIGLSLLFWGSWWLIPVGFAIFCFAVGYSTGPYPLSHHGLGDVAVVVFFGLVPVWFTAWLCSGATALWWQPLLCGVGIGLSAANVLIVNNYRDCDDDRGVGKRTTVVIFGRKAMATVYLVNGWLAALLIVLGTQTDYLLLIIPFAVVYAIRNTSLQRKLVSNTGSRLNPLLGNTAILLLLFSICFVAVAMLG